MTRPKAKILKSAFAEKVENVAEQIADVLEFYHEALSSEQYSELERKVRRRVKSMLKERVNSHE